MTGWALNFWKYMLRTREKHLETYVHNSCFWVKSYTWFTSLYHILYFPMLHMDIIFLYKWNIFKNGNNILQKRKITLCYLGLKLQTNLAWKLCQSRFKKKKSVEMIKIASPCTYDSKNIYSFFLTLTKYKGTFIISVS